MTDFYSGFWGVYIAVIVIASLIWLAYLLKSQTVLKLKKGETAEVLHHKWDEDLQEFNNPLPAWWVGLFILTIVFAVGYLIFYPGLVVFGNVWNWTSTGQYQKEVAKADDKYGPLYNKFINLPIPEVAKSAEARDMGKRLFGTYCIQCHGVDARGAKGFPNLTDADWLYGGEPAKIEKTIAAGRHGAMPAFGAAFGEEKIKDVANFVIKLSGRPHNELRAARGEATFKQVCAACHTPAGTGNQDVGAPNLTDKIWLYGGSEATIIETVTNGRNNVMPAWKEFLGDGKVHVLAGYVYSLSHSETK
ncbi:Cbb3-type cytochrome c oxidase subunit CcoP [Andreprevotia sp. IGB-42]|uniref:cytochrome-c oxidase, cbb3-type subunit III n=1 Tax=Andreprevotia sp. IGB-42 TaxID=2497473 RepID=UPI0013598AC5|nr:cytochrome-c oxidase, cbb3-type subunit III [Andreprevotia sp. IGB-42]KAF0813246.1 Cbb3-type cytochrome c oxidase subunit CcoP [Andreprevotia sp. IGB-42]